MANHLLHCVVCAIIVSSSVLADQSYRTCTGSDYGTSGYTFKTDRATGQKVWSHCYFPTPVNDHALCGRSVKSGRYYLCDPDQLLDASAQEKLEVDLYNIRSNTSTLCTASSGDKQSFIVVVLLIDRIRVPDLQSTSLCLNDCNEFQPGLNLDERTPTEPEQYEILRNFADSVRGLWGMGACDNDALVLYCKQFNKIYISAGKQAEQFLTESKIESMTNDFGEDLNSADFQTGLLNAMSNLANSLRLVLRSVTIADAVLASNIVVVCLFGAWLVYYLFFRKLETNIWGQEMPYLFFEFLVEFLTGIWFIKHIVLSMAAMANSKTGLLYALLFAGMACLTCFVMYGVSSQLAWYKPITNEA